jgi:ubiquinol-cytochrome c reductase cytochrome c1 subunit
MMRVWLITCCVLFSAAAYAEDSHAPVVKLDKAKVDVSDYASLQRGARLYMDMCSGCHSLKYERYDSLAKGIQITDENGKVLEDLVKSDLMFVGNSMFAPIETAMRPEDAAKWFGIAPPDLTLEVRYRGADWVYNYLRTFYVDNTRPWGVNNLVYPSVAMPHVLLNLQGEQVLTPNGLKIVKPGVMTPQQYDRAMLDITNFLAYVAEPTQLERHRIGIWVLVFLGIFVVFSYLLKREYWKDVHK